MNRYAEVYLHKAEGDGVHNSYKERANKFANVMWRVRLKGRENLADDIPLHMSLKTFDDRKKMPTDHIKQKVHEMGINRPDPKKLKYHTSIFKSPRTGEDYYMLHLHDTDPNYHKFNDHFKGQGITHPQYMAHVTIDKDLYDQINKEGLKHHEIEFGPLMIEHGANNPVHVFKDKHSIHDHKLGTLAPKLNKSEDILEKGFLRNVGAAMGVAGAIASASIGDAKSPKAPTKQVAAAPAPYSTQRMLNTISSVESSGGKNTNHKELSGMHQGEKAFGKYGLTPVVIRETIRMHPELKQKHKKAMMLRGDDMANYMKDNPGLEDVVAKRHLQRLEHHFGKDPSAIGYSWLNGIKGTYDAKKNKVDIKNHWHVQKINDAYSKGK